MKFSGTSKGPLQEEKPPPVDYRGTAEAILGMIEWEDPTKGYCKCPGLHLHTNPTGDKDTEVRLADGRPPTVYCFHESCKTKVDEANALLRSELGKQEYRVDAYEQRVGHRVINKPIPTPEQISDDTERFLSYIFNEDDIVSIQYTYLKDGRDLPAGPGINVRTAKQWIEGIQSKEPHMHPTNFAGEDAYAYMARVNPVKMGSKGKNADVTDWKYTLIESDEMSRADQERILRNSGLPIAALIDSGGKSIHAWVRVDASNERQYHKRREKVWASLPDDFIIDTQNKNPSRFSRLPGAMRGENEQKLLALGIGPSGYIEWEKSLEAQLAEHEEDVIDENPFPIDGFKNLTGLGWAAEVMEAVSDFALVPIENIAPVFLMSVSVALGNAIKVVDSTNLGTYPNLFIFVILESGTGKSKIFNYLLKPVNDFEKELIKEWKEEKLPEVLAEKTKLEEQVKAYRQLIKELTQGKNKEISKEDAEAEIESHTEELEEIQKGLITLETKLTPYTIYKSDVTQAHAQAALIRNHEQLAILTAEGRTIVNNILGPNGDMGSEFYLQMYSGDPIKVGRQTDQSRNEPINEPIGQVLGLIQEDKWGELDKDKNAWESGLLPRILVAGGTFPEPEDRGIPIPESVTSGWASFIKGLLETYRCSDEPRGRKEPVREEPFEIQLPPEAEEFLWTRETGIKKDLNKGKWELLKRHVRRRTENTRKFILILHALRHRREAHGHKIDMQTVRLAVAIEDWFFKNLLSHHDDALLQAQLEDEERITEIINKAGDGDGWVKRDTIRRKTKPRKDVELLKPILGRMLENGILEHKTVKPTKGTRVSDFYRLVSPK